MTATRSRPTHAPGVEPLTGTAPHPVAHGAHDPIADPVAATTFSERVVARVTRLLAPRHDRRSFLVKSAVVGSAIVANPLTYILRPGTAYAALCGTCSDGWTAFCCTINAGRNSCPAGSFVAGWWKADNAAYCCGAARYIIDCNATCPTQCSCRCSGDGCDGRRTCCNQFRYGQCHQEIACYGPVVCRVATCTPPWRYDPSCTSASATDNRTVTHGSNCLGTDCGPPPPPPPTPIAAVYADTGGAGGFLGPVVMTERSTADGRGRYAIYRSGGIWWTSALGAHEVHGRVFERYHALASHEGPLGFPTTHESAVGAGRYNHFERGSIWYEPGGTAYDVRGSINAVYRIFGGPGGVHGWPRSGTRRTPDGYGVYNRFEYGAIYQGLATGPQEVHGRIFERWDALDRTRGPLGYPTTHELGVPGRGARYNRFERGSIWFDSTYRTRVLTGAIDAKFWTMGGPRGRFGLPTGGERVYRDGGRSSPFEHGRIYQRVGGSALGIYGPIYVRYSAEGGAPGRLGYPVTSVRTIDPDRQRADFQRGTITYRLSTGEIIVS